ELAIRCVALCGLPLPGRGHQPRRLAVLPLPTQPAHGRRDAGSARHRRQPRDRAAVGAQVRPGLRQPDPAEAPLRGRQMAPRRGRHQDRRGAALALACRGSERDGAGCAGAEPARQARGQAPAAQAAQAAAPGTPRHDHRQAPELRGGQAGGDARCRAPPAQGPEQPGGKLAPADAT
ncbi:MAG: Mobile element protein, partial [uncultured Craurococcus sp.]